MWILSVDLFPYYIMVDSYPSEYGAVQVALWLLLYSWSSFCQRWHSVKLTTGEGGGYSCLMRFFEFFF
jgi:hypothetical protein